MTRQPPVPRNLTDYAHTNGKRLWINGRSYIVIWALYENVKKKPHGVKAKHAKKSAAR